MSKESKIKEKKVKEKKIKTTKPKKHFFKDTKAELKKVIWPTPKQLFNNTLAVVVVVLLIGLIVFVLDVCFDKMNSYGIEKLKTIVQSNNTTSEDSEVTNTEDDSTEAEAENEVSNEDITAENIESTENIQDE